MTPRAALLRLGHDLVLAAGRRIEHLGAVRPGTATADGFAHFGDASLINHPVGSLFGTSAMHIGSGTLVGRGSTLTVGYGPGDTHLPDLGLVIGDRCVLGAGVVLTAHERIEIGDDVWFGNDVFVSDSGHGYQQPDRPIGDQLGAHAPVRIGSGSWIGHGAVILPGTNLGEHVVVGAGSVVRGTVPDHFVMAGVPARVVRRYEPGNGWVSTTDPADVRPEWAPADVARMLD